jgi:hypothetical protein
MLNWTPSIGDPTPMGWVTVFFYFLTSAFAFITAYKCRLVKTDFRFWGLLAIFLFLLGINKQLDLQSFFTAIGRVIAKKQGWYNNRRPVQFVFVVAFFCMSLFSILFLWWMLRKNWHRFLFPIAGVVLMVSFIVIRAASFHHVDCFLKNGPAGVRMNWILELGGTGWLLVSALHRIREEKLKSKH